MALHDVYHGVQTPQPVAVWLHEGEGREVNESPAEMEGLLRRQALPEVTVGMGAAVDGDVCLLVKGCRVDGGGAALCGAAGSLLPEGRTARHAAPS